MTDYTLNNRTVLYEVADDVPQNEDINSIVGYMMPAMINNNGIGLAAPQIGISKRIILVKIGSVVQAIINPVITRRRLGKGISTEGCLSFPGMIKKVKRDKQIIVEGYSQKWEPVKMKLRGLDSCVVQHEIDHLNGITIKSK